MNKDNNLTDSMRIGNTNIPLKKHLSISLTYVQGIGKTLAKNVLDKLNIPHNSTVANLTLTQRNQIINEVERNYTIENTLKKNIENCIIRNTKMIISVVIKNTTKKISLKLMNIIGYTGKVTMYQDMANQ
jgi:ribosomal protein S13